VIDEQRTWIYSRKSRALGDPDDPALLASHRAAMLDLARRKGVAVPNANIVMEIGSGETISERPSFQALLHIWERLPLDAGGAVLVPAIDRLSRGSLTEQARVQAALARADIRVWTPTREYDLSDVDASFVFDLEGLFARRELELFKRRQAAKRAQLLKDGRSANLIPPFCYDADRLKRTWVPHPQRFAAVQSWCKEVYTSSLRQIAERWGVSVDIVHWTLRNPAIAGWPRKQYRKQNGKVRRLTVEERADPAYWPERQGDYPPVISLDEWQAIQEVLDNRRIRRAKTNSDDNGWVRDALRFEGYPDLVPSLSSGPRMKEWGGKVPTYQVKPPGLPHLYVPRQQVHEVALRALAHILDHPDGLRDAVRTYLQERSTADTAVVRHATAVDLEKQVAAARRRLDRLGEAVLNSDDAEILSSNARLRDKTAAEIKALRLQIQQAQEKTHAIPALDEVMEAFEDTLPQLSEVLDTMVSGGDCSTLRVLVRAFVARIWVQVQLREGMKRRKERIVTAVEYTLPGLPPFVV
jgi:DNA invertase Pin-like site-specific DNA recombinase